MQMKSIAWFLFVTMAFLISAHRSPAPITEIATPTPEQSPIEEQLIRPKMIRESETRAQSNSSSEQHRSERSPTIPPKQSEVVRLGSLIITIQDVKRAGANLEVYVRMTNTGKNTLYVFASTPDPIAKDSSYGRSPPPNYQVLNGRGSDDAEHVYELTQVTGFTSGKNTYFEGANLFQELAPAESSDATFILRTYAYSGKIGVEPTIANITIELATLSDLQSKGSHRTKSLTLTHRNLK